MFLRRFVEAVGILGEVLVFKLSWYLSLDTLLKVSFNSQIQY